MSTNNVYYPIIYVRGYAMTRGEIDQTTADPFCGFNLGSTVFRAAPDKTKPARKFIFESPVVRLGTDFGYSDTFEDGLDITDDGWTAGIPLKSIIVYRYYEPASSLLGASKTPEIETFATGLSDLILRVRTLVCADPKNAITPDEFRCYLVAHSMGGLVCRAFLQNPALGSAEARRAVDKVFTYATPHNGIDVAGLNVPSWLGQNELDTFNRERMASFLDIKALYKKTGRVDWLPDKAFPSSKFFCMVGTNRNDYEAGMGLSRTFVGHGSDGLVRIENASVWGVNDAGKVSHPSPTAYTYRSHSGYFGIVNSEEAYQNLVRFLFGDLRIDLFVDVAQLRLPADVQAEADAGKPVDALYQFEALASPRGKLWYLTRRVAEEDSVACASHAALAQLPPGDPGRRIYLSSVFLARMWRVNPRRKSLAYSLTLGVRVPDYEVARSFWPDRHYEGGYLFRDAVIVEMTPKGEQDWTVKYGWQSKTPGLAAEPLTPTPLDAGRLEFLIPFGSDTTPGVNGQVRCVVSSWNV